MFEVVMDETLRVGDEEGGDGGAPAGDVRRDPAIGEHADLGLGRHCCCLLASLDKLPRK